MAEAWVYIDESQAPSPGGTTPGKPFRVGALLVEVPIDEAIPRNGLAALAADPDAKNNAQDQATLARGYFHASLDSQNAHSAITRVIVAARLDATFSDVQWWFQREDSTPYGEADLHVLLNLLASLSVAHDDYDRVNLIVARREGTFAEPQLESWPGVWRSRTLAAFAKQPNIAFRFPAMTTRLVSGREPGLQVCDFILWAVQRARLVGLTPAGKPDWFTRVGLAARQAGGVVHRRESGQGAARLPLRHGR